MRSLCLFIVCAILFSGCLSPTSQPAASHAPYLGQGYVVDDAGAPIPYAQIAVFMGDQLLFVSSADATGFVSLDSLPPAATRVVVGAPGFGSVQFAPREMPLVVRLQAGAAAPVPGLLGFGAPLTLPCTPTLTTNGCDDWGDSSVAVGRDGTIWAAPTCCGENAERGPIWISRDLGASFAPFAQAAPLPLSSPWDRLSNFAVDEAGNVYQVEAAHADVGWLNSYAPDGHLRWRTPIPQPLLATPGRVQAGAANEVFLLRNSLVGDDLQSATFLASADGGRTFDPQRSHEFTCGASRLVRSPASGALYMVSPCLDLRWTHSRPTVWTSTDDGHTWDQGDPMPAPRQKTGEIVASMEGAVDAAGNLYVAYFAETSDPAGREEDAIYLARRTPQGAWSGPIQLSPFGSTQSTVGIVAGDAGHVAVMSYHKWEGQKRRFLLTAVSVDADQSHPHFQTVVADPDPVALKGRCMGTVIGGALLPDGRLAVAYSNVTTGSDLTKFVLSDGGLRFTK